jgi:hypothetical protein
MRFRGGYLRNGRRDGGKVLAPRSARRRAFFGQGGQECADKLVVVDAAHAEGGLDGVAAVSEHVDGHNRGLPRDLVIMNGCTQNHDLCGTAMCAPAISGVPPTCM